MSRASRSCQHFPDGFDLHLLQTELQILNEWTAQSLQHPAAPRTTVGEDCEDRVLELLSPEAGPSRTRSSHGCRSKDERAGGGGVDCGGEALGVQGYLAHKKTPIP